MTVESSLCCNVLFCDCVWRRRRRESGPKGKEEKDGFSGWMRAQMRNTGVTAPFFGTHSWAVFILWVSGSSLGDTVPFYRLLHVRGGRGNKKEKSSIQRWAVLCAPRNKGSIIPPELFSSFFGNSIPLLL